MFRTRDYVLMLSTIVLLLVGIVVTAVKTGGVEGLRDSVSAAVFFVQSDETSYTATVPTVGSVSREERIASLRKKIAELGFVAPRELEVEATSTVPEVITNEGEIIKENRCATYHLVTTPWNPKGISIEEAEGARLVYRKKEATIVGTSTVLSASKEVVLQLPLRSMPLSSQGCIGSDVIGISKTGSLIKNSDIATYASYGAGTLIGYALDGFPIYGRSDSKTDICGGILVGGQYRYQITSNRETILSCFAGVPVVL